MDDTVENTFTDDQQHLQHIARRSIVGLTSLISRSFIIQLISFFGFFLLSIYLERPQIGIFFAVNEFVGILGYFSDIGLAAALIQSKTEPTKVALRTCFTFQQLLVITISIFFWLLIPWIANLYELNSAAVILLKSLVIGFLLSSLKTIPSVLLERQLKFEPLVIVETLETIVFYGFAVTLAMRGWGELSYAYAVIARGLVGIIAISFLSPWPIGLSFSREELHKLLKFGLPYQGNTFIAAIKDRLLNVILLKFITSDGMGILGWAQTWSQKPLRFISDNVTKVTFPAFSRIQDHRPALTSAIDKMLFFSAASVFPILIGAGVIIDPLVDLIPRYAKWEPALIIFYLYLFNSGWAAISTPITNTLAAIGHIKTVTNLMIMWTILTWTIIAPLAYLYGYQGAAVGTAIVSLSSVVPMILLYRRIPYHPAANLLPPLGASVMMGIVTWLFLSMITINWGTLITSVLLGAIIYPLALFLLAPQKIKLMLSQARGVFA